MMLAVTGTFSNSYAVFKLQSVSILGNNKVDPERMLVCHNFLFSRVQVLLFLTPAYSMVTSCFYTPEKSFIEFEGVENLATKGLPGRKRLGVVL